MPLIQTTAHEREAIALLLEQFKGRAAIEALVSSVVAPLNLVESTLFDLLNKRIDIDNAEGVQLDAIGDLLARPRQGLSDANYRTDLRAKIQLHASNGTRDALITLTGDTVTIREFPNAAAEFEAFHEPYATIITDAAANALYRLLNRGRAAGVYFVLHWRAASAGSPFAFDGLGGAKFDGGFGMEIAARAARATT